MKKMKFFVATILLLLQFVILVKPVQAALSVISVTPETVNNSAASTITITGTDFVDGAVVKLNGSISLATTFGDATQLTAVVPQGTPTGTYTVAVVNPDTSSVAWSGSLTVVANTSTPEPSYVRPVVVISGYETDPSPVEPGKEFTLKITVENKGQVSAMNLLLTFAASDFMPLNTGGVLTVGEVGAGSTRQVSQTFFASQNLWGYGNASQGVDLSYTNTSNQSFSESFNMTLGLKPLGAYSTATPTPTATVMVNRPRLLVTSSSTDVEILQPGTQFELILQLQNVGNEDARNVNMVVGGAALSNVGGTDTPGGGYTATGGDFQNFSPLGSSNVQALGDITVNSVFTAAQSLIVNVSTNPGAYTLKISFVYQNARGETLVDDQVITLLVQSVPMIDVSFYRDPGQLFTYQMNNLPIQIVNLGRKSVILGNMVISASNGMLENNTMQVGYLDSGGYLTLDAFFTPDMAGTVALTITVDYVDDFNQPKAITKELVVEVIEVPVMEFPEEMGMPGYGMEPEPVQGTFWQNLWRFIKGLLGLDSSRNQQQGIYPGEMMPEDINYEEEGVPVQVVPRKGP